MDEFELIKNYFQKLTKKNPSALKLNDDVFFDKKNKIVLSIDTYNEGVHYIDFKNPELIIKKIIRSSISDLICKGVKPKYFLLSGSGNKKHFNKKNLNLISKSIHEEQKKYNIMLSGGDTSISKISSFSIVSLGFSKNIVRRNNVKKNDDIYVTGNLGDSYIGLNILKKKININNKYNNYFIRKYFLPELPIILCKYLIKIANSSIDISDGLFADLNKLINNQKIGYIVYLDKIPISKNLNNYLKNNNKKSLNFVSKGDDYQILFTSSKKNRTYIKKLAKRINLRITQIGNFTNIYKQRKIISNKKHLKSLNYQGYSHKF
jgi:thiamine-monophosphate kinase|tara:strand:+ start:593 stop:1552 length:960 start_codon:yes stop_codon:yes gene_type:complete